MLIFFIDIELKIFKLSFQGKYWSNFTFNQLLELIENYKFERLPNNFESEEYKTMKNNKRDSYSYGSQSTSKKSDNSDDLRFTDFTTNMLNQEFLMQNNLSLKNNYIASKEKMMEIFKNNLIFLKMSMNKFYKKTLLF